MTRRFRAAVIAAMSLVVLVATTLFAATTATAEQDSGVMAVNCEPDLDIDLPDFKIDCRSPGGVMLGSGVYLEQSGSYEVIKACDARYDGRDVWMTIEWDFAGGGREKVVDTNGGSAGCGRKSLNLREGYPFYIQTCVQNMGCSGTYAVQG